MNERVGSGRSPVTESSTASPPLASQPTTLHRAPPVLQREMDAERNRVRAAWRRPAWSYNFTVSSRTADYLEAIEHLPPGARLVIPHASWEEYERLLEDLVGWQGVRASFPIAWFRERFRREGGTHL